MRWFGAAGIRFQHVSETSPSQVLQLIALLFFFPCFKLSNLCFKGAYLLNQRRLRRLSSEYFFLKFYDRPIASGSIMNLTQSLRHIKSGLDGAQASKDFPDHAVISPNVADLGVSQTPVVR
jgi:hypothetical protein